MSSEESIQPSVPPAIPPSAAAPDPMRQSAFLGRLRHLLEEHQAVVKSQGDPPMAGMIRVMSVFGGLVAGWACGREQTGKDAWGVFILVFMACAAVPDVIFWMLRRQRLVIAHNNLYDQIEAVYRLFPEEVDRSGGVSVLADRVELEALVTVLKDEAKGIIPAPDTSSRPH